MAHTQAGKELTEANRQSQVRITAAVVNVIRNLFMQFVDLNDIDESSKVFISKALPVVMEAREIAYDTAVDYLEAFRRVELEAVTEYPHLHPSDEDRHAVDIDLLRSFTAPDGAIDWGGYDPHDDLESPSKVVADLHTSSALVAKANVKRGLSDAENKKRTADTVAAKAVKLVANGGRAPLVAEVRTGNRGAIGYARVVDVDPCPFCAMLASRGAVYRSDAFEGSNSLFAGDGHFKVHDGCECTLEPIYGRSVTDLPPGSAELAKEWAEVAAGRPDPFAYWRRFKESGTLPGEERSSADTSSVNPSAPQYGRDRARASGKRKGRKQISEIDSRDELEKTLRGMYVRRAGLEKELAELEARGQTVKQPGPAQAIDVQLKRLEKNIRHANKRLANM